MAITRTITAQAIHTIYGKNSVYQTSRTSMFAYTSSSFFQSGGVGQFLDASLFWVYRSFIFFDTSFIPVDSIITNAYISGEAFRVPVASSVDFSVELLKYNYDYSLINAYPNGVMPEDELQKLNIEYINSISASKDVTLFNTSILINDFDIYSFTSPDLDTSYINKLGMTTYAIVSNRDVSEIPPTGDDSCNLVDNPLPELTIEYEEPTPPIFEDITISPIETAQSTETAEPSTVTSTNVTNEDQALSNDGTVATMGMDAPSEIKLSDYGISVPDGAIITGVEFETYTATDSDNGSVDLNFYISKDGTNYTLVNSIQEVDNETAQIYTTGGSNDTLTLNWTPSEFENFSTKISSNVIGSTSNTYIGFVRVKIYYKFNEIKTPIKVSS